VKAFGARRFVLWGLISARIFPVSLEAAEKPANPLRRVLFASISCASNLAAQQSIYLIPAIDIFI
jgi:hypothetical protein